MVTPHSEPVQVRELVAQRRAEGWDEDRVRLSLVAAGLTPDQVRQFCGLWPDVVDGRTGLPLPSATLHAGAAGMGLQTFPVAVVVLLTVITLGVFGLIWVNLQHGRLPRLRPDDPTAGQAIGYMLIPVYGLYWVFHTHLRLCHRLDEARQAVGLPARPLRLLTIATCTLLVVPPGYVGCALLFYPILAGMVQSSVNEVACRAGSAAAEEPPASGGMADAPPESEGTG